MRNSKLKEVRSQWKESRFFYGKNRVMQLALGRTEVEEYKEGLHNIAQVCTYVSLTSDDQSTCSLSMGLISSGYPGCFSSSRLTNVDNVWCSSTVCIICPRLQQEY